MDDKEREPIPTKNGSGNEESQSNTDDEGSQSNSEEESSQSNSEEESSQSNLSENNGKMQFSLSIDKAYTSAAKSLLFGIVRNHNKMAIDTVHSSLTGIPEISEKVISMLTSESLLRAIENGDMKTATEFLKSSCTFHERRCEASCVKLIDRKFPVNICNDRNFAEKAQKMTAKSKNAKAFCLITSALFFETIKTRKIKSAKRFLNSSRNERSMRFDTLCMKPIGRKLIVNVVAFDMDCLLGSCISFCDWLESIAFSPYRILHELVKFEQIVDGVTTKGWTALHLAIFQFQSRFGYVERVILRRLLGFGIFDANALTDEYETLLHFACRCLASNEQFALFIRELLKFGVNVNQRNSKGETALMVACKTGNIAAVREILKWKYAKGKRVNINARDENGQTALSFAAQSNSAEIVTMIEQDLFLRAVENGDIETVKIYLAPEESHYEETDILTEHHECNCEQMETESHEDDLIGDNPPKRFKTGIETQFTSKDSIAHSVRLEAIAIAQEKCRDEMLDLLFNDDRFIHGFNEDGQTILHQAVAEYLAENLASEYCSRKLKTIEILLKTGKFSAQILNVQNETIFEFVCKIKPKHYIQIEDLLLTLLQNEIDLNGKGSKEETLLMLACENERFDIVCSLLNLTSSGFHLDVDAVNNSGETALMKAKQSNDSEIVATLLGNKLTSADQDEKLDIVKSLLFEFRNTSNTFVKSWSSNTCHYDMTNIHETKFRTWLHAMYIAMEKDTKHSEEILKLLLDCDILLSQEVEIGILVLQKLMPSTQDVDDKELHLIEMLLKSRKINVNDREYGFGGTALHLVREEKFASLLIRYGADVNKKDIEGQTPLISLMNNVYYYKVPIFGTILKDAGTLVDLNATACNGQTALMKAVLCQNLHAVELLLNKGASVNLSDHLGFTALHHALYVNISAIEGDSIEGVEFPRNSKELKKIKEIAILFDAEKPHGRCDWYWRNEEWSEARRKIVEMLLQRPDIEVNLLSIEKFSPLDIAEGCIPEIPSSVKDALKEKGAVLNVFRQTESQSTSDFHLDVRCKFSLKNIISHVIEQNAEDLGFLKERLLALIDAFKEQLVVGRDQQGRTALHLTAIFSYSLRNDADCISDLANPIVDELISLGCNINETDIFGRTPLHYANKILWKMFISKGADASIKDKDGTIATDETSLWKYYTSLARIWNDKSGKSALDDTSLKSSIASYMVRAVVDPIDETYFLSLLDNEHVEIKVQYLHSGVSVFDNVDEVPEFWREEVKTKYVPQLLWNECEYAFRHPLVAQITKEVIDLMDAVAKKIERLDPKFKVKPIFVGGSNEGTRLEVPDEFDFCFVLTKISELCEVFQSPELPTGFVRLKQKPTSVGKTTEGDVGVLFMKDRILNTEKLTWQFTTILLNALVAIEREQSFGWNLELPRQNISHCVDKVLNIKMIKSVNFASVNEISVDIVPCIHIDGWWPDEAISNVSDNIMSLGCNFVFDNPQKLYPWVPYSESCARISFSKAESDMIKQSCDNAREAYMIGKTMVEKSESESKYTLKNCMLYCIEALMPTSEKASQMGLSLEEMKSKFHEMDRYLWLRCLMKCHLEFVAQDFCPCYFLPNFSSPNGKTNEKSHLKDSFLDWITDQDATSSFDHLCRTTLDWMTERVCDFPKLCKKAYAFHRCTLNDTSESCWQFPAPDPLWERFDRNQLIARLCEIAYK